MKSHAFTLIELLVVVLIIGILAAVALPQYQKAVYKARATQAVVMLKSIMQAEQAYYLANNEYTTDFTELDVQVPENLIMDNVAAADRIPNTYYFTCAGKSYCSAGVVNNDMPGFEFANDNDKKKYCISYGKSEMARNICKSMGPSDTEAWQPNDYYFIN